MASVTPILRKQKKDSDGQCPIWLRISDRHKTRFHSLGEKVLPSRWNPNARRVRRSHRHSELLNRLIDKEVDKAKEAILKVKLEGDYPTADHVKQALAPEESSADLLSFWQKELDDWERRGNISRLRRLRTTMRKIRKFAKKEGKLPLTFDRLTVRFLRDFQTHCLTDRGNKQSTVATNLSDMKAVVNRAIDERLLARGDSPFERFEIEKGETPERTKLSFEQIRAMEDLDLEEGSVIWQVRNVFLFAFYAAGIRFSDVAMMTAGRIDAGDEETPDRLVYRMGKTGKRQSVKISDPAREILDHYLLEEKSDEDFVFPLLEGYDLSTDKKLHNARASQNTICNKYLKKIADRASINENITMHVARHSFADAARTAGWSLYDISKALRHSSLKQTERYLKAFDSTALDAQMDELFGGE